MNSHKLTMSTKTPQLLEEPCTGIPWVMYASKQCKKEIELYGRGMMIQKLTGRSLQVISVQCPGTIA